VSIKIHATVPLCGDLLGEPSPGVLVVESEGQYTERIALRLPNGTRLLVFASALKRAIDAAEMGNQ
jgi:hypothetical protein